MKKVLIWDWPVRLCHWLIAVLFVGLVITGRFMEDALLVHFYLGYILSAVLLFRLIYGVVGSHYARISSLLGMMVKGPKHLLSMLMGKAPAFPGHNPAGAWMVLLLWGTLCLQWGSGLFANDEVFWFGPLYGWVNEETAERLTALHHFLPNLLIALVGLHLLAVLYHEVRLDERLSAAMITGKKRLQETIPVVKVITPTAGALLAFLVAGGWLFWLLQLPV